MSKKHRIVCVRFASKFEWILLWILSGYALDRSAIVSLYDGSYFKIMEKIKHAAVGSDFQ